MGFNYSKNKEGQSGDSFWTSYSDLFLGLSTIFLLLYVMASLRSGTDGLKGQIENQKLSMQVEELQHQLKMYESVKNEYLANQAPKDEVQEYQELMDKLTLLQEDTKSEKDRLVQQALENDTKVKALNKYQQMVRNVLNANKMAKSKIINRDDLIKEQDVEIETQDVQITSLQQDIDTKKNLIAQGERRIMESETALQKQMKDLQKAYQKNKMTKALYQQKVAQAKAESEQKIGQLAQVNEQYQNQLQAANSQMGQIQNELQKTQGALVAKEGALAAKEGELGQARANAQAAISGLQDEMGRQKAALEGEMGRQKAAAAARMAGLSDQLGRAKAEANAQIGGLKGQMGKDKAAAQARLAGLQGQLEKAQAELEARKSVAGEIQKGFAKAGIKADIDMETGDVVLDFGQTYFDSDSAKLKAAMKGVIEKAMPIYSQSLFGNPKVSDKVSAVEIIGFASPTYQGRFVNPMSQKADDKTALKYNMDLSYRRAKSIFNYVLDGQGPGSEFAHQKELMAKMKVSGRSFLEVMNVQGRNVATAQEFCRLNDCKKAQRVIIRFSMDQKK